MGPSRPAPQNTDHRHSTGEPNGKERNGGGVEGWRREKIALLGGRRKEGEGWVEEGRRGGTPRGLEKK